MKKMIITAVCIIVAASLGALLSAGRGGYQVVEIYLCEEDLTNAELYAKTVVSRKELSTVSYCTCEGVDPSLLGGEKKESCKPPRDMAYSCSCIGKTHF